MRSFVVLPRGKLDTKLPVTKIVAGILIQRYAEHLKAISEAAREAAREEAARTEASSAPAVSAAVRDHMQPENEDVLVYYPDHIHREW